MQKTMKVNNVTGYINNTLVNNLVFIGIGIFIFNETTRTMFSGSKVNQLNIIYIFFVALFMINAIYHKRMYLRDVFIISLFSGVVLIQSFIINKSGGYFALLITTLLIPLYFVKVNIKEEIAVKVLGKFLSVFNVLCITLVLVGIVDYLTNGNVQVLLATKFFRGEVSELIFLERASGIYRYYSFMGHPLTNARYFLLFFSLNNIYSRYSKPKMNNFLIVGITLIGLILSGSKGALILTLFLMIFCSNIKKHKWVYYLILIISLIIVFNTSLFQENLLQRYIDGISRGDISTGRNEHLNLLFNSGGELPKLLLGGGNGYSRVVAANLMGNIDNFEYSAIMLAYDYGIIGFLIIYYAIFFSPILKMIKEKNFFLIINFSVLFLLVNCNNGLANFTDSMAQFCFIALIFRNLKNHNKCISKNIE